MRIKSMDALHSILQYAKKALAFVSPLVLLLGMENALATDWDCPEMSKLHQVSFTGGGYRTNWQENLWAVQSTPIPENSEWYVVVSGIKAPTRQIAEQVAKEIVTELVTRPGWPTDWYSQRGQINRKACLYVNPLGNQRVRNVHAVTRVR